MLMLNHTFTPEYDVEQDGEILHIPALHHWLLICQRLEHGPKNQEAYCPLTVDAEQLEGIMERCDSFQGRTSLFEMWERSMRCGLRDLGCRHYDEREYLVA